MEELTSLLNISVSKTKIPQHVKASLFLLFIINNAVAFLNFNVRSKKMLAKKEKFCFDIRLKRICTFKYITYNLFCKRCMMMVMIVYCLKNLQQMNKQSILILFVFNTPLIFLHFHKFLTLIIDKTIMF